MNTNVDQFGIPHKGFIQADKERRAQQHNTAIRSSANWLPREKAQQPRSVISSLISSKSAMIAGAILLLMTLVIAFLVGENRVLSTAASQPNPNLIQKTESTRQEIVALQSEIELEKLKISREQLNKDSGRNNIQISLSSLQHDIAAQNTLAGGLFDDKSLSMNDPLSGTVVKPMDPEIEAMRERTLNLIEAQNKASEVGQ